MTDGVDESVVRHAIRMTFQVEGDEVRLVDKERVTMVPPPSAELFGDQARSGAWFELRGEDGRALYRRAAGDPLSRHVEVPTGDPAQPLGWRRAAHPPTVFTLLVPDLPEARNVVLLAGRPSERRPDAPEGPDERYLADLGGLRDRPAPDDLPDERDRPDRPRPRRPWRPTAPDDAPPHDRSVPATEIARFNLDDAAGELYG